MNDERTMQTIQAIKNREEIPKKYISASRLLSFNGMSDYEYVCCNRLSEYIDNEHIMIDLFSDNGIDIILDDVGINECESVLKGYISSEKLQGYQTYIRLENEVIESQNIQIKAMRSCPTKSIKCLLKNTDKYFGNIDRDKIDCFLIMLRTELKARNITNRLFFRVKNFIKKLKSLLYNYYAIRRIQGSIVDNMEQ